jgi:hypothetical protein
MHALGCRVLEDFNWLRSFPYRKIATSTAHRAHRGEVAEDAGDDADEGVHDDVTECRDDALPAGVAHVFDELDDLFDDEIHGRTASGKEPIPVQSRRAKRALCA